MPCRDCGCAVAVPWAILLPGGRPQLLCWRCEEGARQVGRCPLDDAPQPHAEAQLKPRRKPRAARHAFCPHQLRCAACDASFRSCADCRLSQGDGDVVVDLCARLLPAAVFLDFDRTLCSTKSGGSPYAGGPHTLDPELLSATALYPTHVVTRNSHEGEIRAFLAERGVRLAGLCVTSKGRSKAEYVASTLAALGGAPEADAPCAVFVDDSVAEVGDPKLVSDARVWRVLFQRAVG